MLDLFNNNHSGATFSECGKHRYKLWRIWDESLPKAMVIGLNPSTANESKNDPTINHLSKALNKLGYGGFYMMNCWTYISTKPEGIKTNPMAEEWNSNLITVTAASVKDVIFAWGAWEIVKEKGKDKELIEMFPNALCFGKNSDGTPEHPMFSLVYKKNKPELQLIPFAQ